MSPGFVVGMCFLIIVLAGTAALLTFMRQWQRARSVQTRSVEHQMQHNDALRAIELAKAWEKALQPDTRPQLERSKETHIRADDIEERITYEDVVRTSDPALFQKYIEQERRLRRDRSA